MKRLLQRAAGSESDRALAGAGLACTHRGETLLTNMFMKQQVYKALKTLYKSFIKLAFDRMRFGATLWHEVPSPCRKRTLQTGLEGRPEASADLHRWSHLQFHSIHQTNVCYKFYVVLP